MSEEDRRTEENSVFAASGTQQLFTRLISELKLSGVDITTMNVVDDDDAFCLLMDRYLASQKISTGYLHTMDELRALAENGYFPGHIRSAFYLMSTDWLPDDAEEPIIGMRFMTPQTAINQDVETLGAIAQKLESDFGVHTTDITDTIPPKVNASALGPKFTVEVITEKQPYSEIELPFDQLHALRVRMQGFIDAHREVLSNPPLSKPFELPIRHDNGACVVSKLFDVSIEEGVLVARMKRDDAQEHDEAKFDTIANGLANAIWRQAYPSVGVYVGDGEIILRGDNPMKVFQRAVANLEDQLTTTSGYIREQQWRIEPRSALEKKAPPKKKSTETAKEPLTEYLEQIAYRTLKTHNSEVLNGDWSLSERGAALRDGIVNKFRTYLGEQGVNDFEALKTWDLNKHNLMQHVIGLKKQPQEEGARAVPNSLLDGTMFLLFRDMQNKDVRIQRDGRGDVG